jgi:hypothetical protein
MKTINDEIGFIEGRLLKRGIRLSSKGRSWAENLEAMVFLGGILLVFGIVGSIESGKWF